MKKPKALVILTVMILTTLFAISPLAPVRAVGPGTVFLSPSSLTGTVGSTLDVQVMISGSAPYNGFDIQVVADRSVLQPVDAILTGSIISSTGSSTEVIKCIDGVLKFGLCAPQDGPGVIHYAAVKIGPGNLTGDGLLFTAVYSILSRTVSSQLTFNTGCSPQTSAPPGVGGVCITISNGTAAAVPENEGAPITFSNLKDFTISSAPSTVNMAPNSLSKVVVSVASQGGLTGQVKISQTHTTGITVAPAAGGIVTLDGSLTFNITSTAAGSFSVTFTGTHTTAVPTLTHSVTVTVNVAVPDFTLSADPSSLSIASPGSGTTAVSVAGQGGLVDTVTLSATSSVAGVTTSFSPGAVSIDGSTATGTSTLTVKVGPGVAFGTYTINVTGTGGITHFVLVSLTVLAKGFTVTIVPTVITIPRSVNGGATITLTSVAQFAGTVAVSANIAAVSTDSAGNTAISNALVLQGAGTCTTSCILTAGGTNSSEITLFTLATDATGNYTATITATSGTITQTAILVFYIQDYTLQANHPVVTITNQPGIAVEDAINIYPLGGWADLVAAIAPGQGVHGTPVPVATTFSSPGDQVCLVPTLYANGTQLSFSRQASQGPIIASGSDAGGETAATFFQTGADCGRFDGLGAPGQFPPGPPFFGPGDIGAITGDIVVNIQTLPNTPIGTYTARLYVIAGPIVHTVDITVIIVAPVSIHQSHWSGSVSVGAGGIETFRVSVANPSTNPTLYTEAVATGISTTGGLHFAATSAVISVPSGSTNTVVYFSFNLSTLQGQSTVGKTFTVSISLIYGVTPDALVASSTATSVPGTHRTGSIIVTP